MNPATNRFETLPGDQPAHDVEDMKKAFNEVTSRFGYDGFYLDADGGVVLTLKEKFVGYIRRQDFERITGHRF